MKKNNISMILIIFGIILISTSLGIKGYCKHKEKQLIKKFNNNLSSKRNVSIKRNNKKYNKKVVEYVYEDYKDGEEVAIIEIPHIELKSIIVQSTENKYLRYYLGHFKETAYPGEDGNFCIAGHSSYIYNEILNNLHKVNIGDKIKLKSADGEFVYVINEKIVVDPSRIDVLKQDKSKKTMTIVTCTDGGKKRLIVKAELL